MLEKNWTELIETTNVDYTLLDNQNHVKVAKLILYPLEKGYGHTLGNSLRRVLLSSVRGVAIQAVRMEGVVHEYSSIRGIREDMIRIIQNIKRVVIRCVSDEDQHLFLKLDNHSGDVTAGHITSEPGVEILNPSLVLFSVSQKQNINMELIVGCGKSYVSAKENRGKWPFGFIAVDALYNPVRRVTYQVENARAGQVLDLDKLILEVETNGVVDPKQAISIAARIIQEQLLVLSTFGGIKNDLGKSVNREVQEKDREKNRLNQIMSKKINELELSVRAANCLANEGVTYIGDLVKRTESEMLRTPNFGRKSLNEIKQILSDLGLSLGMKLSDWSPEFKNEEKQDDFSSSDKQDDFNQSFE